MVVTVVGLVVVIIVLVAGAVIGFLVSSMVVVQEGLVFVKTGVVEEDVESLGVVDTEMVV